MRSSFILAAAILVITAVFASGLHRSDADHIAASGAVMPSEPPSIVQPSSSGEASIKRGPDGHFSGQGSINGALVTIMVDSGASLVVLDADDAMAAGISVFPHEFTATAQTAGGTVKIKPVMIDRVAFAGIERRNVRGAVVDTDLPAVLLGQSFLSQLGGVSVSGDTMQLR